MAALAVDIQLIVGLCNPGPDYEQTRHNAGFWFVDEIARSANARFQPQARFHGEVCKFPHQGRDILLLKPATFMNRSGQAIRSLANYYKVPIEKILVAHDELDLQPGTARLKTDGGHGGHNGLKDTISHMGGKGFHRVRIGIGHPGHRDEVVKYVLQRPTKQEQADIEHGLERAMAVLPDILEGAWEKAMHKLHSKP